MPLHASVLDTPLQFRVVHRPHNTLSNTPVRNFINRHFTFLSISLYSVSKNVLT